MEIKSHRLAFKQINKNFVLRKIGDFFPIKI